MPDPHMFEPPETPRGLSWRGKLLAAVFGVGALGLVTLIPWRFGNNLKSMNHLASEAYSLAAGSDGVMDLSEVRVMLNSLGIRAPINAQPSISYDATSSGRIEYCDGKRLLGAVSRETLQSYIDAQRAATQPASTRPVQADTSR